MPASDEASPILPGLSPICGRPIVARFDGAQLSSDGGLLVLRQVDNVALFTDGVTNWVNGPDGL